MRYFFHNGIVQEVYNIITLVWPCMHEGLVGLKSLASSAFADVFLHVQCHSLSHLIAWANPAYISVHL